MKKRKKMLAVISAVAAISAMCSAVAFAEDDVVPANTEEGVTQAADDVITGTHGGLTWSLEGGTLTFSGGGI